MDNTKSNKKRVKCANCGMIYDIILGSPFTVGCPKCGSNAYDEIPDESIWKYKLLKQSDE